MDPEAPVEKWSAPFTKTKKGQIIEMISFKNPP
jgi:hypothetical protein